MKKLIGEKGPDEKTALFGWPYLGCCHTGLSSREDFRIDAIDNIIVNHLEIFKEHWGLMGS